MAPWLFCWGPDRSFQPDAFNGSSGASHDDHGNEAQGQRCRWRFNFEGSRARGLERKDGWKHWKMQVWPVNLWNRWLELFQLWLVRPTDPYWELKLSQQQEAVDMGPNLRTYLGKAWEGYILIHIYICIYYIQVLVYPMGTKISQFLFCSLLHG